MVGLVFIVLGCTPRTNNPIPATMETGIVQAKPIYGNDTEVSGKIIENPTFFDWIDINVLSIPPEWSYSINESGPFTTISIDGKGVKGAINMIVWYVMEGDPYIVVNDFSSQQAFYFDNGRSGYMLKDPLSGANSTVWLQSGPWIGLGMFHDNDDSVFIENEELILKVAKTLRCQYE